MPMFEVEYEYLVPEYGVLEVEANHMDEVEELAEKQIWEIVPEECNHISVESVREKTITNA